jgi:hypothetical protein
MSFITAFWKTSPLRCEIAHLRDYANILAVEEATGGPVS